MKEIVHAIFSLEFTQTVILLILGVTALVLPTIISAYATPLPTPERWIIFQVGLASVVFGIFNLLHTVVVAVYLLHRNEIKTLRKFCEAIADDRCICPTCGTAHKRDPKDNDSPGGTELIVSNPTQKTGPNQ